MNQLQLFDWETTSQEFAVNTDRCFILSIVDMKMRLMMLSFIRIEQLDDDVVKPT